MGLKKTRFGGGLSLLIALSFLAVRSAEAGPTAPASDPPAKPITAKSGEAQVPGSVTSASKPDSSTPAAASAVALPASARPSGGPAAPSAVGAPSAPTMDGPTYAVRLRDLEQRIDDLKEQIRRSHTRLSLLSDTILSGGGAGSRSAVRFQNELSSAFRVTRVLVVLDGAVQYNKTDQSGALSEQSEIPIFNGSVPPGDHTIQVIVNLQGNGYGVFSYLRGYRFEVKSSHSFTAVEGKTINLDAVAYEKGGVTTPLEERPAVRYMEKVVAGLADPNNPTAPGASPSQPPPTSASGSK
jgi:hypothetical protein